MTYDANGNTLSDGLNSYVWDARNRLASADNNAASFAYDPLGRRVSKTVLSTTTNYLYDGANAVQEFGTLPTANLLTGGVDERFQRTSSTETDDYLTDALGSTVELTNASGAEEDQYSFGPYGSPSETGATTTNSYAYTGRESDGLGIDYYRARYYNPTTGRFLSEDPLGFLAGPNFYAYAADDPIDFVDPSGMQEIMLMEGPPLIDPALMDDALRVANPRQTLDMPDGGRLDLTGKPHIDPDTGDPIPTPHVHFPNPPFDPPFDDPTNYPPGLSRVPRPATPDDLKNAIRNRMGLPNPSVPPLAGRKSAPDPCSGIPNCI
jgi:RHS repeat-associated protein